MLNINENKLKLSGTANLSKELELTKNYDIIIKNAEVRKIEDLPTDKQEKIEEQVIKDYGKAFEAMNPNAKELKIEEIIKEFREKSKDWLWGFSDMEDIESWLRDKLNKL